jgi:beta-mannosidase
MLFFSLMSFSQNMNWFVIHPIKKDTLFLGEKGTVQEALINIGELPDPFIGENENKFTWIEDYDWIFIGKLMLTKEHFDKEHIELEFPSIDTYASIYIDNHLLGKADNAFVIHRFDIKKYAKIGENFIKVVFQSPVNYHKAAYEKRKTKLPAPNDVGHIKVASMSRKPQYQFGWDWALRMNTIGFWKPIKLNTYNDTKVELLKVETKSIDKNLANLELFVQFSKSKKSFYRIESQLFGIYENVESEHSIIRLSLTLKNPKLWWPNGHGKANIYEDNIKIYNNDNVLIDERKIKFGVRTSELIQEKDQWGTSFYFKINGVPIFCKGANYIPQDAIPTRVDSISILKLIRDTQLSNFNMIRVWGGGYYPDDCFYENCDEFGIMVWQDFMFACAVYPGNDDFIETLKNEFSQQIPRISAHPSVVYFNGNNEVDVAWKNWGFQLRYMISPKNQRKIEKDYQLIFKSILPKMVREFSFLPYEHTSPLSNWGKDEFYNHGTMHYWGVWHGKDPLEDFGLKTGRFNAEYGFQSFPEFSTLKSFSEEKDWNLNSSVMKHHQKSYVGNGMIKKHADILFGEVQDFKRFVYYSQLTQSKAVGIAVSSHRSNMPRCMGTLFWQLNDCWQAPTWSSIDYFHNWKALQYQVKKDYEPIAVIQRTEKIGFEKYFITSDLHEFHTTKLSYDIYNLKGEKILSEKEKINLDGIWLQEIAQLTQEDELINSNYVIVFKWTNHENKELKRTFFHQNKNYKSMDNCEIQLLT